MLAAEGCILQALCWAHLRRRFRDAGRSNPELSAWAEAWRQGIWGLYQLHRAPPPGGGRQRGVPGRGRRPAGPCRADVAGPERGAACTRGRAGRWSTCAKRWAGYTRFLDDPSLPLDNNLAARLLRTPVLCRKNWGLIGAAWAAAFAAALWTVVETAKRNGCNPLTYLIAYFEACAARGGQPLEGAELERFLPWALSPADRAARPSARPAALPVGLTLPPAAPAGRCAQGLRNRRGPAVWSPRSAMRPQLPRRSRCPGPRRPRPAQELRLGKRRASRPTGSPSRPAGCRGPTQCRAVRSRRPRQPRPPCRGTVRLPPSRQGRPAHCHGRRRSCGLRRERPPAPSSRVWR